MATSGDYTQVTPSCPYLCSCTKVAQSHGRQGVNIVQHLVNVSIWRLISEDILCSQMCATSIYTAWVLTQSLSHTRRATVDLTLQATVQFFIVCRFISSRNTAFYAVSASDKTPFTVRILHEMKIVLWKTVMQFGVLKQVLGSWRCCQIESVAFHCSFQDSLSDDNHTFCHAQFFSWNFTVYSSICRNYEL